VEAHARSEGGNVKLVHIVGKRNHGKTTLVEELVRTLEGRGLTVGTIKHCGHPHPLDVPGKDSYRHQEAGACTTLVITPDRLAVHLRREPRVPVLDRVKHHFDGCDLVLCEGWLDGDGPKVEVWRAGAGGVPLAATRSDIAAVVTDDDPAVPVQVWPRSDVASIADHVMVLASSGQAGGRTERIQEEPMQESVSRHDPLLLFVEGHDGVSEWLHNLEATVHLRQGGENASLDTIRAYFDENVRAHFTFEEEVLFPILVSLDQSPELRDLIQELRCQHIEIVNDASLMFQELALAAATASKGGLPDQEALVRPLVDKIMQHAAVEDHRLLPIVKVHREEIRRRIHERTGPSA